MGLSPMPVPRGAIPLALACIALAIAICALALLLTVSHAEPWTGAWIPYTSRPQIEAQWAELQRILHTSDDKLTPAERKWKQEWTRGN